LNLYGYFTDLVVCNRLIPDSVSDEYFARWKVSQAKHLETIKQSFNPIPVLSVPLFDEEVVGLDSLRRMALTVFGEKDPSQIFYHGHVQTITETDGRYVMSIVLPFIQKSDISVLRKGDELVVHVGQYRRNISLPRTLAGLPVGEAKFENENLKISFPKKK